jgi:ABC-type phosphate/phosphonate transport system permease subunit
MSLQFVVNRPRGPFGWWIMVPIGGLTVAALWWSAVGTRLSISGFIDGLPWIGDFIGRMLPPNFAFMQKLVQPAIETVQIALWGTLLGIVLALPVCFFAARNLSPYAWVFHGLRQVLNVMRGINEIILALIFVAAVGLGPFAGVLAIALHGIDTAVKPLLLTRRDAEQLREMRDADRHARGEDAVEGEVGAADLVVNPSLAFFLPHTVTTMEKP